MSDFRRGVDAILRDAESQLSTSAVRRDPNMDIYGHRYASGATHPLASQPENFNTSDMARQLRVCMKEIMELRSELSAEREGRNQLMLTYTKRIKDELMVEIQASQHCMSRDMRELEHNVKQRIQDTDQQNYSDKRRFEELQRALKAQDRDHFELAEQMRESNDELRGRVDAAMAMVQQSRSEFANSVEQERTTLQHKFDVELLRFNEMHRSQQQALTETRNCVSKEMQDVGKAARSMVNEIWEDRIQSVVKVVNDTLAGFRKTNESTEGMVKDIAERVITVRSELLAEMATSFEDHKKRLIHMEGTMPVLSTRVDRFERKADAVMETNTSITGSLDGLRDAHEKTAALGLRCMERVQRLDDSAVERDSRIASLESLTSSLSNVDRLRMEIDGAKRSITRVESQMESVKQTADRDERLVDQMQRNMDSSIERADQLEKKAHKMIARVETSEQRISGFVDRVMKLEEGVDSFTHVSEQGEAHREQLQQRVDIAERRVVNLTERVDGDLKTTKERCIAVEGKIEAFVDTASRLDHEASSRQKTVDRLEKKLQAVHNTLNNVSENVAGMSETVQTCSRETSAIMERSKTWKDSLARQENIIGTRHEEVEAMLTNFNEQVSGFDRKVSRACEQLEKRSETRIEDVNRRLTEMIGKVDKRAKEQHQSVSDDLRLVVSNSDVGKGGHGGSRDGTMSLSAEMALNELKHRCNGLDNRLSDVERGSTVAGENIRTLQNCVTSLQSAYGTVTDRLSVVERSGGSATTASFPKAELRPQPQLGGGQPAAMHGSPPAGQKVVGRDDSPANTESTAVSSAVITLGTSSVSGDKKSVTEAPQSSKVSSVHDDALKKPSEVNFDDDSEGDAAVVEPAVNVAPIATSKSGTAMGARATLGTSALTIADAPAAAKPPASAASQDPKPKDATTSFGSMMGGGGRLKHTPFDTSESDRDTPARRVPPPAKQVYDSFDEGSDSTPDKTEKPGARNPKELAGRIDTQLKVPQVDVAQDLAKKEASRPSVSQPTSTTDATTSEDEQKKVQREQISAALKTGKTPFSKTPQASPEKLTGGKKLLVETPSPAKAVGDTSESDFELPDSKPSRERRNFATVVATESSSDALSPPERVPPPPAAARVPESHKVYRKTSQQADDESSGSEGHAVGSQRSKQSKGSRGGGSRHGSKKSGSAGGVQLGGQSGQQSYQSQSTAKISLSLDDSDEEMDDDALASQLDNFGK